MTLSLVKFFILWVLSPIGFILFMGVFTYWICHFLGSSHYGVLWLIEVFHYEVFRIMGFVMYLLGLLCTYWVCYVLVGFVAF